MQNFSEYGYVGVFAALIAAGFGFPIPEELPVLTAGILVGHEDTTLHWYIMLPVVIAGVVFGDAVLYGIGRIWGSRLLSIGWVQRKILPEPKRIEIERNFAKRGIMVLLGARMLPGIRTPIFLMAGILRVPLGRFLLADGLYAIPLVNLLFWLAYILTDQVLTVFGQIQQVQKEYGPLVIVIVFSGIAGALIYKYVLSRQVSTGEPPHVPQIISKPAGVIGHVLESAVDKVTKRHQVEKSDADPEVEEEIEVEKQDQPPATAPSGAVSAQEHAATVSVTSDNNGVPGSHHQPHPEVTLGRTPASSAHASEPPAHT